MKRAYRRSVKELTALPVSVQAEKPTVVWRDHQLTSHFQPIFSLAHSRLVGHEALLRGRAADGSVVAPTQFFAAARSEGLSRDLDLTVLDLHLRTFEAMQRQEWLFVNVDASHFDGASKLPALLASLLRETGLPAEQLVVEILESQIDDLHLVETVEAIKSLGCVIALDDFGAGHSNLDRIWRLSPHLIKFDRSVVAEAARSNKVGRVIPRLVNLIHEANAMVLMEGIETEREALIAMEADVDLVQGYYFGKPAADPCNQEGMAERFRDLWQSYSTSTRQSLHDQQQMLAPYRNALGYAASLLRAGIPFEAACRPFMELAESICCFVLDDTGVQVGDTLNRPLLELSHGGRFAPLTQSASAVWSRRHYFRRAIQRPGSVHATRPYFSLTGVTQCITLSIAERINGDLRVVCGDLLVK